MSVRVIVSTPESIAREMASQPRCMEPITPLTPWTLTGAMLHTIFLSQFPQYAATCWQRTFHLDSLRRRLVWDGEKWADIGIPSVWD